VEKVSDSKLAKIYGVNIGCALIKYDFVLVTEKEATDLRRKEAEKALKAQGGTFRFVGDLPVPDVD
jgi:hypothetical protein